MNQKKKNISLIVLLAALVSASLLIALLPESSPSGIEDSKLFSVQDTASVDQIILQTKSDTVRLEKRDGVWILNSTHNAEHNIVKILLSILRDAEAVRNVPKSQASQIALGIRQDGIEVQIFSNEQIIQHFYAAGNDNKTLSYMMPIDVENPMIVGIPGYDSFVAGIFEISANDWRDRTILSTNYRTLQKLEVDYVQFPEYDFTIEFKFNFLNIEGIQTLDTARMMSYVEQFNYFQVDRYLDGGQNEKYDSLLSTPRTVRISITDIDPENSKTVDFYPLLPDDSMMLGYVREDEQMVLFQANRIQNLFAVKEEFEVND